MHEAPRQLTHPRDRALLDHLRPVATRTLVVVRHAHAIDRARWPGPDTDRPLSEVGVAEAERLVPTLDAYGIRRVVTSPARRCVDTVLPHAVRHGLGIHVDPAFAEEVPASDVREATLRLRDEFEPTVLCTHRPIVPTVCEVLGFSATVLEPAEYIVVHLHDTVAVAVERPGRD
jgi:8-oxo-(d)GTP phosphatase